MRQKKSQSHRPIWDLPEDSFGFSSERDLVAAIREIFTLGNAEDWIWFEEFESPAGIADLVGVNISTTQLHLFSQVPSRWLYALTAVSSLSVFSVEDFAKWTNASLSQAATILRAYEKSGFCRRSTDRKFWQKTSEPQPIAKKIIAIEAKLTDWKRALAQAWRYTDYATEAWVVLDAVALPRAIPHMEVFRERGIGLAGLDSTGDLSVVVDAVERVPRSMRRFWQANADVSRRSQAYRAWRLKYSFVESSHGCK